MTNLQKLTDLIIQFLVGEITYQCLLTKGRHLGFTKEEIREQTTKVTNPK